MDAAAVADLVVDPDDCAERGAARWHGEVDLRGADTPIPFAYCTPATVIVPSVARLLPPFEITFERSPSVCRLT